ncbi:TPA: hypothetical protein QDB43_001809 [Burkholderia vietnamiensis]|nr:hypothetical protein WI99_04395 [Burkholderia cepacia]KVF30708.1 hypothetical protein WJ08_15870 [Burkholderia vietnamiensis]KVF40967.1 hypothetical protein WJ10_17750 [Burkholderia vietnamiensis]HDR9238098.1 hypothetical protein [Burkholderia vietnamiensis]
MASLVRTSRALFAQKYGSKGNGTPCSHKWSRDMPFAARRRPASRDHDSAEWDDLNSLPADKKNKQPARSIISVVPHRIVGGFDLPGRAPYALEWESYLERVCYATLAMSQDVEWMASQPDELQYVLDGVPRRYYPDLFVRCSSGEYYVEVKPLAILVRDDNLCRYTEIARKLRIKGKNLVFLTDEQILSKKERVENVMLMRRYISGVLDEQRGSTVVQRLSDGALSISELTECCEVSIREIYTMVARRYLTIDWDQTVTLRSSVTTPTSDNKGLAFETLINSGRFYPLLAQLAMGYRPQDQRMLELAKIEGQRGRTPEGPSIVGGFPSEKSKSRIYEPDDVLRNSSSRRIARNRTRSPSNLQRKRRA